MGEALALLALLLFSANALLVSVVSPRLGQEIGFLLALGANVVFSGLVVLLQRVVASGPFVVQWDAFAMFAVGGLFTSYLGRRLFFLSVHAIGPSRATSLQITNPVFAGIISWIFLGERLGVDAIGFILAVILGLYLTTRIRAERPTPVAVASGDTPHQPVAVEDRHVRLPGKKFGALPTREIALALTGAFSYAVGNVIRSTGVREWNEPVLGGFVGAVAGTLAYLLLHTQVRSLVVRVREADRLGVYLWGLSGVLTISAQIALIASTRYIPIAVAVVVAAALPVIVIPVSVLFLHNREAVTGRTVVGGLLILGGVAGLLLT
ncbi:MAG: DMT family transporter [Mycobacteriales bacterium]